MKLKSFIRKAWRARVKLIWRDIEWPTIWALGLIAVAMGVIGFKKRFDTAGSDRSFLDLLYLSLQLFVLESGSISPPLPWELEAARLIAPAVSVYTASKALIVIFDERLRLLRARFLKNHVVVCGLGRKGLALARDFHRDGYQVAIIEKDESNPHIEQCREEGIIVLVGDATDRLVLRRARISRASFLLSVCADDGVNAEVAVHARDMIEDRRGKTLTCLVHIFDSELYRLLREKEIESEKADSFRLEFFNVYESGARELLREYPAFDEADTGSAHPVIVGLGRMGESLIIQAARQWWSIYRETGRRLRMTIIDRAAEARLESLRLRYPQLDHACELIARAIDPRSPEFQRADFLFNSGVCEASIVYICLTEDSRSLSAALALLPQARKHHLQIVVRLTTDAGLATLLEDGASGFDCLKAFGLLNRMCRRDLVLGGANEIIARAIYEDCASHSVCEWEALAERAKESFRHQADHIKEKYRAVDCAIEPLTDWSAPLLEFSEQEVEEMARLEHARWMDERKREGWIYRPGPEDEKNKTTPCLVEWDSLLEEEKESRKISVRAIPAFLARAGFQIYCMK